MTIARREFLAGLAAVGGTTLLGSAGAWAQQRTRRYSAPVIDAHLHWYPPEFVELIEKEGASNGVRDIRRNQNGEVEVTLPGSHPYMPRSTFRREMTDINRVMKMMDDREVDMSVIT